MFWRRPSLPPPEPLERLYVIGDVHGHADLLHKLLDKITADDGAAQSQIVFVGDYIDRGPDSATVLKTVETLCRDENAVALKGNHEAMAMRAAFDGSGVKGWLTHGGEETLMSFGIKTPDIANEEDAASLMAKFREKLDLGAGRFLQSLPLQFQSGNIFVSHAGADPKTSLDKQTDSHLMWGKAGPEPAMRRDGTYVAFGHFARSEAAVINGHILVDTGAYFSGRLTAARIDPGEISFLTAEA